MTDEMKETPKKAKKDESSHEEATVISARVTEEKKSKTGAESKKGAGKTSGAVASVASAQPGPAAVKSEAQKIKSQPPQTAQPPADEMPKKGSKRTVLIVVIVAIVLICCCVAAVIAIYMATGGWGGIQDLFGGADLFALSAMF